MTTGAAPEEPREPWAAPQSFRDAVEDTERLATALTEQVAGQVVVRAVDVDFLTRRLLRLTQEIQRALPPEVT